MVHFCKQICSSDLQGTHFRILGFNKYLTSIILCLRDLDLKKPIYQRTASYGHFGRDVFSWEVPKKLKY